jgi:hypothetical protein
MALQRFLYFGTVLVVWLFHRKALRRGGLSIGDWWKSCWGEFNRAFQTASKPDLAPQESGQPNCAYSSVRRSTPECSRGFRRLPEEKFFPDDGTIECREVTSLIH